MKKKRRKKIINKILKLTTLLDDELFYKMGKAVKYEHIKGRGVKR